MLNGPILTLIAVLIALIIGGLGYAVSAWPKKVFYEKLHAIDELYSEAINNPHNYVHRPQFFAQTPPTGATRANLNSITNDINEINKLLPQASEADDVHDLYKKANNVISQLEDYAAPLPAHDMDFETTKTIELNSCFRDLRNLCLGEDINAALKSSNLTLDDYYDKYIELYTHIADSTSHNVALLPNPHELSPQETISQLQRFFNSKPIEQGTDFIKYYQYKVLGAYSEEEWKTINQQRIVQNYINTMNVSSMSMNFIIKCLLITLIIFIIQSSLVAHQSITSPNFDKELTK